MHVQRWIFTEAPLMHRGNKKTSAPSKRERLIRKVTGYIRGVLLRPVTATRPFSDLDGQVSSSPLYLLSNSLELSSHKSPFLPRRHCCFEKKILALPARPCPVYLFNSNKKIWADSYYSSFIPRGRVHWRGCQTADAETASRSSR